ncbi:MAG: hemerythrin domain-containing protein [Myxococcota bacterium]|nr:hemerythrin domain-containing protein [Myxococcota bacterium]
MTRTAVFRRQHLELLEVAAEISDRLDAVELTKDASMMAGLLSVLSGKLTIHLAMEDKGLYPRLQRHSNERVRALATKYMTDMGSICQVFGAYIERWRDRLNIQNDAAAFVTETRGILGALSNRIAREDNELYPMVDREG